MVGMIARAQRGGWSERRGQGACARDARHLFGPATRARWVAAFAAIVMLWCNCAFAAEPRVLLLRGWFGVFSTGLDGLAEELKGKGINAEVASHLHWSAAVSDILRERSAGRTGPIVLVGHSQGANNVIDIARSLEPYNVQVDLLVTLAPFLQNPIPSNVMRAINYYQSPGWGAPLISDRGFHGKLSNIDVGEDLSITHVNIDKSTRVHADILREIVALSQAKEEDAASRPPPAAGGRPR